MNSDRPLLSVEFDASIGIVVSGDERCRLPQIPEEELEATIEAGRATLNALNAAAMPAATRRALASVLRYWSLWYAATFGETFPLVRHPREAVSGDAILLFIAHHSASRQKNEDGSRVVSGMPPWVRDRLFALRAAEHGATGQRHVCNRATATSALIEDDVVALKTLQQRVSLLGTLHENFGLKRPQASDGRIRSAMTLVARAARRENLPTLPQSKQALVDEDLKILLAALPRQEASGWDDVRDRAMLLASFSGGGRRRAEVMAMEMDHLALANFTLADGRVAPGYRWSLFQMKGRTSDRLDKPLMVIPIIGTAATALAQWISILQAAGYKSGPVWRRVYVARSRDQEKRVQTIGARLKDEALADTVKKRVRPVLEARFASDGYAGDALHEKVEREVERYAAHSLRSGYITSQLNHGVDQLSIMKMTGHESVTSFKIYDQRRSEDNPTLGVLLDSGL